MNSLGLLYTRISEESLHDLSKNFYLEVSKVLELRIPYPEDLDATERGILLFLAQIFGGRKTYSETRGLPRLRMRHLQWILNPKMHSHWMDAMSLHASVKSNLEQEIREEQLSCFTQVAKVMMNHD